MEIGKIEFGPEMDPREFVEQVTARLDAEHAKAQQREQEYNRCPDCEEKDQRIADLERNLEAQEQHCRQMMDAATENIQTRDRRVAELEKDNRHLWNSLDNLLRVIDDMEKAKLSWEAIFLGILTGEVVREARETRAARTALSGQDVSEDD